MMENIIKGWFTTIMGMVAMGFALYGYAIEGWTWQEAGGLFALGFTLLYMRDKISEWISQFVKAILEKFGAKKK